MACILRFSKNQMEKHMRIAFAAVLVAALTGCAATPGSLKSDPSILRTFDVDAGYQIVLKRLVDQHRECTGGPLLPIGQVIFDVQNYTELKTATITHGASGFGTQIHLLTEITEPAPNKAHVKVWSYFATDRVVARIRKTAEGVEGCGP